MDMKDGDTASRAFTSSYTEEILRRISSYRQIIGRVLEQYKVPG